MEAAIDLDETISVKDDSEKINEEKFSSKPKRYFSSIKQTVKWIFPRLIALIFFIVLFLWIYQAEGGIGSQDSNLFGWHALLMSIFIVIFCQESILSYNAPLLGPFVSNFNYLKYYHITFHVLGMICACGGLLGIIYYKSLSSQPVVFPFFTLYSPHSWLGVSLLSLWTIQMFGGICSQTIVSKLSPENQITFFKYHRFLGKSVYVLGLATCSMGLQDMQSSDLAGSTAPSDVGEVAMIGYLPNSNLAQYSSAGSLLLLLNGLFTFLTFV